MTERIALTVDEVAAALGVGRRTVYRSIANGEIRSFKVGGRTLVLKSELDRLVEQAMAVAS